MRRCSYWRQVLYIYGCLSTWLFSGTPISTYCIGDTLI
uniref:Uncharacterized protein n=1 Tax=Arundo donax TaxID=35708 RepID=A0A0A9BEQ1_ARUDO